MQVQTVNETLVVDSREVAEVLGVGHSDWMRNVIKKYQCEIEADFGHLRFENGTVTNSVGAVNTVIYCFLTEDQATYLMTLSKNTDEVRAAKRHLVKSFSEAKKLLEERNIKVQGFLDWKASRLDTQSVHGSFVQCCKSNGYPGAMVHNYITKLITGKTASEARQLPVVDGDPSVGLNHQPSPNQLLAIAQAKLAFTSFGKKNEPWMRRVERAVLKASM